MENLPLAIYIRRVVREMGGKVEFTAAAKHIRYTVTWADGRTFRHLFAHQPKRIEHVKAHQLRALERAAKGLNP
jgi:hypothetical protein